MTIHAHGTCMGSRGRERGAFAFATSVPYAQVSEIMKNAEAKDEEGEVGEAQELFQQAEELQKKKAELEAALQASVDDITSFVRGLALAFEVFHY